MTAAIKPGWSKPSTILFASEIPANERAFSFALAQAAEFGAELILFHAYGFHAQSFHAYDTLSVSTAESLGIGNDEIAAAGRSALEHLEPLAERVREAGVGCEAVVRPGLPAEQIVAFLREREIDRIVMGTHSPGPIGKLLVGSVAEAVLRAAEVPVCIIGPQVKHGKYRNFANRTILCGVSLHTASSMVVGFAAELAAEQGARLILQHVIGPQERHDSLDALSIHELEAEMAAMIPAELQSKIAVQLMVTPGDPTEELLYQGRALQADLIVLGAQGASAFAAVARFGVVYRALAHAHCPVMTLSPVVLAACGGEAEKAHRAEVFLAGVF
jgi:nucleotide-binding universal stress UspA family protein